MFTGPSYTVYTHVTHRIFPLKTSSQTGAELTEISSMVSGEDRDKTMSPMSTPHDSRSTSQSNSPYPSKERNWSASCNGLIDSTLQMSSLSSPFTPSLPCQDKNISISPLKLFLLRKSTGIATSNSHVNGIEDSASCNGELTDNPCNCTTNELNDEKPREQSTGSSDEGRELVCTPTHMPQFLLTYTPPVSGYPHTAVNMVMRPTRVHAGHIQCTCSCLCMYM